jgi:acyl-[acyl carrier protein]--UDP-N-acetylglucosamine O-acyltransferase
VVCANCAVHSNVALREFNTVLSNSLIAHDTRTGANCFFAGHSCVGSDVTIGDSVFVGLNASVKRFVRIGDQCLVGMASNVLADVSAHTVVAGNPARRLRDNAG